MRQTPSINLSGLPHMTPSLLQSGHAGHSLPHEIFLCVFSGESCFVSPHEVVEHMVIARMIYLGEQVQKFSVFMTVICVILLQFYQIMCRAQGEYRGVH
jgi:hypothetical protein